MDKKLDKIGFIIYKIDYIKNKFFWGGGLLTHPPPFYLSSFMIIFVKYVLKLQILKKNYFNPNQSGLFLLNIQSGGGHIGPQAKYYQKVKK